MSSKTRMPIGAIHPDITPPRNRDEHAPPRHELRWLIAFLAQKGAAAARQVMPEKTNRRRNRIHVRNGSFSGACRHEPYFPSDLGWSTLNNSRHAVLVRGARRSIIALPAGF